MGVGHSAQEGQLERGQAIKPNLISWSSGPERQVKDVRFYSSASTLRSLRKAPLTHNPAIRGI